jgi:DNA-binding transcriptional LysR family regulator
MKTTLDEWEALQMVVQLGSFAAAAEKLNRSQSTVSYAIGRLQDQLGVKLLEIIGRRAQLTEAGRALLADAEPLLAGFSHIEKRAQSLISGQSEIRLSADSLFPNEKLFAALAAFTAQYPYVHPRLRQAPFLSVATEFMSHGADLCISGLPTSEYFVKPILEVTLLAVAHRNHPLSQNARTLARVDLIQHVAVIIEGDSSGEARRQPRAHAQRSMTVPTVEAAMQAVTSGLCFGWLPRYRITTHLEDGLLVPLHISTGTTRTARFQLVCRDLDASNQEQKVLAELLGLNRKMEVI